MKRRGLVLLLAALSLPAILPAKVFWGLGGSGDPAATWIPENDPGYKRAYTTTLTLNEGRAALSVWGTAQTPATVIQGLARRANEAGARVVVGSGGPIAWAMMVTPGRRVERVLVTSGEGQYAHVFHMTQSAEEFEGSQRIPDRIPFDVPQPNATRVQAYVRNEGSGGSMATLESTRSAGELRPAYAQQLAAAGWERIPGGGGDSAFFLRDGHLLIASVKRAGADDRAMIILIHKRLSSGDQL